jgi:hypothetical protein
LLTLLVLLAAAFLGTACNSLQTAAAKDPLKCERNPECASRSEKSRDCATQCADESECMKRCDQIQQGIDRVP